MPRRRILLLCVLLPLLGVAAESRDVQALKTLDAHYSPIELIAFSPDGQRLITQSDDRMAVVWKTSDWSVHCQIRDKQLEKPRINAEATVFVATARVGRGARLIFWDLDSCKKSRELDLPERMLLPEIQAVEKDRLLLNDLENLLVYSIPENRILSRILGVNTDGRTSVYLRGDSIVVCRTKQLEIWSVTSGKLEKQIDLTGEVKASTSTNQELALLFASGRVEFRDPSSLALLRSHQIEKTLYGGSISAAANGKRFVALAGIYLIAFDGEPRNLGMAFGAHEVQVNHAGTLLAAGNYDGLVQIVQFDNAKQGRAQQ